MVRIASVHCLEGFTVERGFTDGTRRTLDLDPLIRGPIFEPLRRDPALFRAVRVDPAIGTVVWPNGADLDPDVLRWGLPVVAPDAR